MTDFRIDWSERVDNSIIINRLAQRVCDLNLYEVWDNDERLDSIAYQIKEHPLDVISYLVDIIEDLQA